MSRLTEKVKNTEDYIRLATKDKQEFINKLGRLEDLEEEIGCPLDVFIKALKQTGFYRCNLDGLFMDCVDNGGRKWEGLQTCELRYSDFFNRFYWSNRCFVVNLSDYKKKWWLKEDMSE